MKGLSTLVLGLAVVAVAFGCGGGETEQVEAPGGYDEPPEATPQNISVEAAISHAMMANENKMTLAHPVSGEDVDLTFHFVHEGSHETPGGRHAACVDFIDAEGTAYDVDFYVVETEGSFEIAEAAIHKVGGDEVLPAEERERLEQAQ
jgi:hypothetical protein